MNHSITLFGLVACLLVLPVDAAEFYPGERPAARNPLALHLFPQGGELHGWIAGTEDRAGERLTIRCGDGQEEAIEIGSGNRFRWKIDSEVAETVTLRFEDLERIVTIPPVELDAPVAFFVVDRSVFRPETELQFAAFLRQADARGSYRPLRRDSVEVEITSVAKQITAAKLELVPDEFGRVTGSYQFSPADPLDDYTISVAGDIVGTATVKLAEFRKAKVRLDIDSQREGGILTLKFRALDFLNKTVPATRVRFTARIMNKARPAADLGGMDPSVFPHGESKSDHWYSLTAEQQALIRAGSPVPGAASSSQAVHVISEELEVGEDGVAEHVLRVDPSWGADHLLEVDGVLIDTNNREQKASKSLPLGEESGEEVHIEADHREVPAGQEIRLTATTSSRQPVHFLTFRLRNLPVAPSNPTGTYRNPFLDPNPAQAILEPIPQIGWPRYQMWHRAWNSIRPRSRLQPIVDHATIIGREFLSMIPGQFTGRNELAMHEATLTLNQPGGYVVRAVTHDEVGRAILSETTVVVRPETRNNGLYLTLDSDHLKRGETLRGEVQSRHDGARVLLAVRDSRGVQALHSVTVEGGCARFEMALPDHLALGCEITARYTDDRRTMNLDRRPFLVEPPDGKLQISSTVPGTVEPGEVVELDFDVHRREEVDLVVSVYDLSLLGIAPDRPVDGRSFFHADLRVEDRAADGMLAGYLAGLTPAGVNAELESCLKDLNFAGSPLGIQLNHLRNALNDQFLDEQAIRTLLAWRGAPIRMAGSSGYWRIRFGGDGSASNKSGAGTPFLDLIRQSSPDYDARLRFQLRGEQLGMWVERNINGQPQILSFDPVFQLDSFGWGQNQLFYGGMGMGRGSFRTRADAAWSVSANSLHSAVSGQAMISHLPMAAPIAPDGEPEMGRIAIRRDFSDSAFFDAKVRTDRTGKATVSFQLPDSLTNWRVVVTGVSRDLHIGRHTATFKTFKPVMVWPMLSQGFTSGDHAKIFATVHNYTDRAQEFTVNTTVKNGAIHDAHEKRLTVPAKSNRPVYFDYEAGSAGFTEILMSALCPAGNDASLKRLPVMPCSAEQVITRSGFVRSGTTFEIPEDIDLRQARLEVTIVPTIAGDMLDTLPYLLDYPHGCVEQTMSRFLPVIKVAQILERFDIEDKKLEALVPGYAEAGIKRLLQLQQQDGGWGWNGNSGTHEMMTPYALFGLLEAENAGFEIPSETAIPRGMDRLAGFINNMGERQSADRIYCMWVYRHHAKLQDKWWTWIEQVVNRTISTDQDRSKLLSDYATALALEMAADTGRARLAGKLEGILLHRARHNGSQVHWTTANFSRWGNDRFEITAAVLKAFAKHDPDHAIVPEILGFFAATKRGNRWNSTKDTAMILYAMCEYLSTRKVDGTIAPAVTEMALNGEHCEVRNPSWQPARTVIPGTHLQIGHNELKFLKGNNKHLYRLVFRYWRNGEDVSPLNQGAKVTRTFELIDAAGTLIRNLQSGDTIPHGAYLRSTLNAHIANGRFAYTLAANPKLSCGEYTPLNDSQGASTHVLKENKASGTFWHHEASSSSLRNSSVYRAELAGEFLIAPAYVELMYDTAIRGHSGSFKLVIRDEE